MITLNAKIQIAKAVVKRCRAFFLILPSRLTIRCTLGGDQEGVNGAAQPSSQDCSPWVSLCPGLVPAGVPIRVRSREVPPGPYETWTLSREGC